MGNETVYLLKSCNSPILRKSLNAPISGYFKLNTNASMVVDKASGGGIILITGVV